MQDCIRKNIEKGKTMGIYRSDIDTEIITKIHVSRIEQAPHSDLYTLEEYTSPGFAREVCIIHLRGLVNEKGQKLLEQHKTEINNN